MHPRSNALANWAFRNAFLSSSTSALMTWLNVNDAPAFSNTPCASPMTRSTWQDEHNDTEGGRVEGDSTPELIAT
eukprot:7853533-Pyramimonas_sp.AAC.2